MTHGVVVSTSAFLIRACHQCWGLSLGLGLGFFGFSTWHFLKLVRGFLWVLRFPPVCLQLVVSANEINAISTLSNKAELLPAGAQHVVSD